MSYSLSDNKMSTMNFPGLHDNCSAKEHRMPDGCMAGKEHPGLAKAAVPAKAPKEPKEPKVPTEKKLNLGKAKKLSLIIQ